MDGIADVTQRIADIRSRFASLSPPAVAFSDVLQAAAAPAPPGQVTRLDAGAVAAASPRPGWASGWASGSAATSRGTPGAAGVSAARGADAPVDVRGGTKVPAELRAHGNGRIPAGALEKVGQGSHRLAAKAAAAWQRMEAAAAQDGVRLRITDSYRDYATQVDLVRRKGLYSQGGLAATPGTSNHGWGLAVDLDLDREQLAWMRANGTRFGFVEDTPREPWHWGFHG